MLAFPGNCDESIPRSTVHHHTDHSDSAFLKVLSYNNSLNLSKYNWLYNKAMGFRE